MGDAHRYGIRPFQGYFRHTIHDQSTPRGKDANGNKPQWGEWFLPFLHGWRSEAARLGKKAKKPDAPWGLLAWAAWCLAPFYKVDWGQAAPINLMKMKHEK